MQCIGLAGTGFTVMPLLVLGGVLLVVGVTGTVLARRGGRLPGLLVLALLAAMASLGLGEPAAHATPTGCVLAVGTSPSAEISVRQTSVIAGLAPGTAARPIAGILLDQASQPALVRTVTVTIAAVAKARGAVAGSCQPRDYELIRPAMVVDAVLSPEQPTTFGGASIAFDDRSVNQDACKGAVLTLRYQVQ